MNMNKVFINGKSYSFSGKSVCITNNHIMVDGKLLKDFVEDSSKDISITIQGNVEHLEVSGSVTVEGKCGNIDCGGSVTVHGDVHGDIDCGGSCKCGNVTGDIDAGGSVSIKRR